MSSYGAVIRPYDIGLAESLNSREEKVINCLENPVMGHFYYSIYPRKLIVEQFEEFLVVQDSLLNVGFHLLVFLSVK